MSCRYVVYGLYSGAFLLYVGSTGDYEKRIRIHMRNPARLWDNARILKRCASRYAAFAAFAAERKIQAKLQPPLSIMGTKQGSELARRRQAARHAGPS